MVEGREAGASQNFPLVSQIVHYYYFSDTKPLFAAQLTEGLFHALNSILSAVCEFYVDKACF